MRLTTLRRKLNRRDLTWLLWIVLYKIVEDWALDWIRAQLSTRSDFFLTLLLDYTPVVTWLLAAVGLIIATRAQVGAEFGLSVVASNVSESTSTSTIPVELSRITDIDIPSGIPVRVTCVFRKFAGLRNAHAFIGLRLNGNDIDGRGQRVTSGNQVNESGRALWELGPIVGEFTRTARMRWVSNAANGSVSQGEASCPGERPDRIESVSVYGWVEDAATTIGIEEVKILVSRL